MDRNSAPQSVETLEQTAPSEKNNPPAASFAFDVLEMFAWSFLVMLLLFTFTFRLCRVDGHSMENTLFHGQNLILTDLNESPKQDDIIVFHLTKPEVGLEKTLVKRVIATGGQTVRIDFKNVTITVDGVVYEDSHSILKDYSDVEIGRYLLTAYYDYDPLSGVFETTVPEGFVFVLGDNRNNSKDSRDPAVGFVDERCILGIVTFRLSPFTVFH